MINPETKVVNTSIQGIGEMQFTILQIGNQRWLREIETFLTQNQTGFTIIAMQKPELKNPLFLQRAIQAFVNHIQAGSDEQQSNQIRNHFRNWLNRQNGSLKNIIYGEQSTSSQSTEDYRDSIKTAFANRYANR